MQVTISLRRVRSLIQDIRDEKLIPRAVWQRGMVWTNADKLSFLDTVLKDYPFPEIYVAAGSIDVGTGHGTEFLVDGQQRVTTIYDYFRGTGDIKYSKGFPTFQSLSDEEKIRFLEYQVVVRDFGTMPGEEIIEIFTRINATRYSLNFMEIEHANYHGELMQLGIEVASKDIWLKNRVFSVGMIRRMQDVSFALRFIVTIMSTYFNRDEEIHYYLETYNDDFEGREEIAKEVDDVIEYLTACDFPSNSRVWNRSDLFTVMVEIHRALFRDSHPIDDARDVGGRLEEFYAEVQNRKEEATYRKYADEVLERYFQAANQATNDRGNLITRGEIIRNVIHGIADIQIKNRNE